MAYAETRRFPRVSTASSTKISTPMMSGFSVVGMVEELSLGGCQFKSHLNYPVGQTIELSMNLTGIEINAVARVAYLIEESVGMNRFGVEFISVDELDMRCIEAYIANNIGAAA